MTDYITNWPPGLRPRFKIVDREEAVDVDARMALPTSPWPAHLRRLFWSRADLPVVQSPDDALRALATILQNGTPDDWRALDWDALVPILDTVPVFGRAAEFWSVYRNREVSLMNPSAQVITEDHRRILRIAAEVLGPHGFELAGGTALAAGYLGHRKSEDLDLFTSEAFDAPELVRALADRCTAAGLAVGAVERRAPTHVRVGVNDIRVELARDAPFRLDPSTQSLEGLPLRSLRDVAADKTWALFDRAAPRDLVDVFQLTRTHYDLSELMALARQKDAGFQPVWLARAMQRAARVRPEDVEMLVPLDFNELNRFFLDAAARLLARHLHEPDAGPLLS